jgi:hypothetical protein
MAHFLEKLNDPLVPLVPRLPPGNAPVEAPASRVSEEAGASGWGSQAEPGEPGRLDL